MPKDYASSIEVREWVERNGCVFRYNPLTTVDPLREEALRLHVAAARMGVDLTDLVTEHVRLSHLTKYGTALE